MKRLIVNADDYGRSPDISRGIRAAHLRGVVTSTSCMMNISTTAADIALAVKEMPMLGMGVHLVLTMGKPILPPEKVPTLVDENGNHYKYDPFIANLPNLNLEEVKAEWRAQIEAYCATSGRQPTHLDSHHHVSIFSPALFRVTLELAREYDCPVRNVLSADYFAQEFHETAAQAPALLSEFEPRRPDVFFDNFYDETATKENLLHIIAGLADGTSEIMCHPGYVDEAFAQESIYNYQRARELQILTDPSIKETIQANGIELITFADL